MEGDALAQAENVASEGCVDGVVFDQGAAGLSGHALLLLVGVADGHVDHGALEVGIGLNGCLGYLLHH